MVQQTYQAVPALISQLAKLEAPVSFHPGHSGLDRGMQSLKDTVHTHHTAVILPVGVFFHTT